MDPVLIVEVLDPVYGLRNEYVYINRDQPDETKRKFERLAEDGITLTGVLTRGYIRNGQVMRVVEQFDKAAKFLAGWATNSAFLKRS